MSFSEAQVTNTSEGSNFNPVVVTFPAPIALTAGTTYYLNLESGAPNGSSYYLEYSGGDSYANGRYFENDSDYYLEYPGDDSHTNGSNFEDDSDDSKDITFIIRGN